MSRKGDCWDNAVVENFFGSLKVEQVFGMKYLSRSVARRDIVDYIEMFYNSRRRYSSLGYKNPMKFEKQQLWKKAAQKHVYFYLITSFLEVRIRKYTNVSYFFVIPD